MYDELYIWRMNGNSFPSHEGLFGRFSPSLIGRIARYAPFSTRENPSKKSSSCEEKLNSNTL